MKTGDDMTIAELRREVERLRDLERGVRRALGGLDGITFHLIVGDDGNPGTLCGGGGGGAYGNGGTA